MKKILIALMLIVMVLALAPARGNYAETNMYSTTQHEIRLELKDQGKAKDLVTINGMEYFLVIIPAPDINDPILVPVPEVNDPIYVEVE